ncbi:LuxR C-terminal-related transcriptional regulator [Kitasatospora sp. RB6PN24]|uniref:helix-turn-helix transcriptional regulator n=1 Tax=Kitasatospora humi TaxID=2893891 RepID=UPI001E5FFE66|nr:LuxR C-terminal-related transcriptional regulator [Kitasatospora humi]MCC9311468.1 LuxR C-terminal-related transcriptional regulator [Kitasatospora humi]
MPATREGWRSVRAAQVPPPLAAAAQLIGRERELLALEARLADPSLRLLTLTGPAGVGKSRLAAAAVPAAAGFTAAWSVDLAAAPGEGLPETIRREAAALRLADDGNGRLLLCLETCDGHGRALATAVAELLADQPDLVVLATSRSPLGVSGERLLPVRPLPVPETGAAPEDEPDELLRLPSVALFVRRAHDIDPGFALTTENAAAVAGICVLLEGLPLALELAARQLRLHSAQALLARLRQRGALLGGGPLDAPERHHSLTALAAWSRQGLHPDHHALLEQLAVFEGGFGLPMAERAAPPGGADIEAALEALLDRHLLTVTGKEEGEPRFAVPEPIRSACLAELADTGRTDAARDRHAEAYRRLLTAVEPRLTGSEQDHWLRTLAGEGANLSAALRRLHERGDAEGAADLLLACGRPWLLSGRLRDGRDWSDRLAADPSLSEPLRVRLTDLAGCFATALGEPEAAVQRHRSALEAARRLGDRRQVAAVSARLGAALLRLGDPTAAEAALAPAREVLVSLGAAHPAAEATVELARVLRARGEQRKAAALLAEGLAAHRRLRHSQGVADALRELAAAAAQAGDAAAADSALRESLRVADELGERTELPGTLEQFALLLAHTTTHQQPRVLRLLAAAEALRRGPGSRPDEARRAALAETTDLLRTRLSPADFATARDEGRRLTPAGAVLEALAAPAPAIGAGAGCAEPAEPARRPLTPRQVQVAMLIAEGLTNRQIAVRLKISEWTVVNHVREVMRRLGCTSRVQVAWSVGRWP